MDGQVRMWDIRTSGCLQAFDQHHTRTKKYFGEQFGSGEDARPDHQPHVRGAHDGHVTAVKPTPDGLCWITAATDSRVRLWDALTYRNMLVNYSGTWNRSMKGRQVGLSSDSELFFHPSGSVVQVGLL